MYERTPPIYDESKVKAARKTPPSTAGVMIGILLIVAVLIASYFMFGVQKEQTVEVPEPETVTGSILGNYFDEGIDLDEDGLFDHLLVYIDVEVSASGSYKVAGALYDENNTLLTAEHNLTQLSVGVGTVVLRFDGTTLYVKRANGPYALKNLTLYKAENWTVLDEMVWAYNTTAYSYIQFQNEYRAEYEGTLSGSSPEYDEAQYSYAMAGYKFTVKPNATWVNITLRSWEIGPDPTEDERVDLYLYKPGELEPEIAMTDDSDRKVVTLNGTQIADMGTGTWAIIVHHYTQHPRATNAAGYELDIHVKYY